MEKFNITFLNYFLQYSSVNSAIVSKLEAYKDCKSQKKFLKILEDQYITNPKTKTKTYGSKLKYACVTDQLNFEGWPEKTWCKDPDLTKRGQDICKEILSL